MRKGNLRAMGAPSPLAAVILATVVFNLLIITDAKISNGELKPQCDPVRVAVVGSRRALALMREHEHRGLVPSLCVRLAQPNE